MKRVILFVLFLLCLLGCMTVNAQDIELYMFGNRVVSDVAPIIENGRTLVPVRAVAEKGLGADVFWDEENRIVVLSKADMSVVLIIDRTDAYVNGQRVILDVPAKIIEGRTMVPVRFISESFNYNVSWDGVTQRVLIDNAQAEKEEPNRIHSINVERAVCDNLINITADEVTEPTMFELKEPYRIVADFEGYTYDGGDGNIFVNSGFVKSVRWANHDGYFRVVVDCQGIQPYRCVMTGTESLSLIVGNAHPVANGTSEDVENTEDTSEEEEELPQVPLRPVRPDDYPIYVIVDPGHGGSDPGALGKDDEGNVICDMNGKPMVMEKDVNLSVALRIKDYLEGSGINVLMTRTIDEYNELRTITDYANKEYGTLFLSIHCNSVEGVPTANGAEVLYFDTPLKDTYGISSMELAENIRKEFIAVAGVTDRGLKERPNLAVLKWTDMPAALVELGFITNASDREKLYDCAWQDKIAAAIARGVENSLLLIDKREQQKLQNQ